MLRGDNPRNLLTRQTTVRSRQPVIVGASATAPALPTRHARERQTPLSIVERVSVPKHLSPLPLPVRGATADDD